MDIQQMHLAVDLGLQRVASFAFDDFLPQEIDIYLNDAIKKYVEVQRDLIITRSGMEEASKGIENVAPLVNRASAVSVLGMVDKEFKVDIGDLDPKPAFWLGVQVKFPDGFRNAMRVTPEEYNKYQTTKFGRPVFRDIPMIASGKYLYGVVSSEEDALPELIIYTYLTMPDDVKLDLEDGDGDVDCNLPEQTHQTIVDLTVSTMWEDLQRGVPVPKQQATS